MSDNRTPPPPRPLITVTAHIPAGGPEHQTIVRMGSRAVTVTDSPMRHLFNKLYNSIPAGTPDP